MAAHAQIVNIESMRGATGDSAGTHGILDGQFYLGGAQNILLRTYGAANVRKSVGNETYLGIVSGSLSTRIGEINFCLKAMRSCTDDTIWKSNRG